MSPERSKTNEFTINFNHSENILFKSTAYKTKIFDRIESNATYSKHENMKTDIKQEGLENTVSFRNNEHTFSLFNHFQKVEKIMVKLKTEGLIYLTEQIIPQRLKIVQ